MRIVCFTGGGERAGEAHRSLAMKPRLMSIAMTVALLACRCGASTSPIVAGSERQQRLFQRHPFVGWHDRLQAEQPRVPGQLGGTAGRFVRLQLQQAQPLMIGMLNDPVDVARIAAVWQVSVVEIETQGDGPEADIDALAEQLIDSKDDRDHRRTVARQLGNLGVAGAEALAGAIAQINDAKVRIDAHEQLSRIPHDLRDEVEDLRPVREAIRQMKREKDWGGRGQGDRQHSFERRCSASMTWKRVQWL